MAEVVDRRSARLDAGFERPDDSLTQPLVLVRAQTTRGSAWMNSRSVQGLVCIDVADAGHPALVEQECLDRSRAPTRQRAQMLCAEALVQRLQPQACRK